MPYSKDQISNINQRGIAIPRKKYVLDNGDVYIGQDSGRLLKRDIGLSTLEKTVKKIPTSSTPVAKVTAAVYGDKYKISSTDNITITDSHEYYIHRNFEITAGTTFTINSGGQLAIGDGILRNNGTLINNGEVILT